MLRSRPSAPASSSRAGGSTPLHDTARTLAIVGIWAALLLAWSYASRELPLSPRPLWPAEIERRAPPLARYDSGWYLKIAEDGYGKPPAAGAVGPSEHVFFPLYPAVVAVVSRALHLDPFAAGMAVSLAALAAAAVLFAAEGRRRFPFIEPRHALLFLLLFPTSFFLLSMYAESLFLLLALGAFACLARGRIAAAALLGVLAGLTRLPALALCVPLAIAAWQRETKPASEPSRGRRVRRSVSAAAVGLAPALGVAAWVLGIGLYFGEPGLFFRLQQQFWSRGTAPLAGLAGWSLTLPERIARGDIRSHPAFLLDYADALLFLLIGIFQATRRRWSDASWTAGAVLLPAATGISASLPRYLVVVYPAFYALADISRERPRARAIWWTASGLLLLAGTAAFVHWRWVA